MTTLAIHELTAESAELLPTRETLFVFGSPNTVNAANTALALNVASVLANAQAAAFQAVIIGQS